MRLLLDVHFSPVIAVRLRERGHDVAAAADDEVDRRLSDEALLQRAGSESRALVSANAKDFLPIVGERARAGRDHHGLLLTSDRTMPRDREAIGRFVTALEALLEQHPAEDAFTNRVMWLKP